MTSEERRANRYARRKQNRKDKKREKYRNNDIFNKVFTYENLTKSYQLCRRNVAWKASVQSYIIEAPLHIFQAYQELQNGIFQPIGFNEFDIIERGKLRHIKSVHIKERVVQRCLCDNALVPILSRSFIYDNGACLKDKGYTFSSNRITEHLRRYYRYYGNEGYVLLFDFSKYFDSINHNLLKQILRKYFTDEKIIKQTEQFIDAFGDDKGVGLGSQISQILALAASNKLDHYVKEKLHIKYYGRYMDDGYLIHPSKEYLQYCLHKIEKICNELGIVLNLKKTQIVKLSHGFTFLKVRYYITSTGKIIKKLSPKSITRMRRKLKKFKTNENIKPKDVYQSFQSWCAYAVNFNSSRSVYTLKKLYKKLYA